MGAQIALHLGSRACFILHDLLYSLEVLIFVLLHDDNGLEHVLAAVESLVLQGDLLIVRHAGRGPLRASGATCRAGPVLAVWALQSSIGRI